MPLRSEFRAMYRTPEWMAARTAVYARAAGRCEACGALAGSTYPNVKTGRLVLVQLGCAHLDHDDAARFHDLSNLRAWCRRCHLDADKPVHALHRAIRKDRKRPLLAAL